LSSATDDRREQGLSSRLSGVAQNIHIGAALVGAAVSLGFFTKEVQRIAALPPLLRNGLYLALLALVLLLIGSWIWCALKHVEQMGKWADAIGYYPPEEVIVVFGFAILFIALIYTASNVLAFGAIYLVYTVVNLFTMRHLRGQTADVIRKTREGFVRDTQGDSVAIRSEAVNALESYFGKLLSSRRAWTTLFLAVCGLAFAAYGAARNLEAPRDIAYLIFIASVAIPELVLSWYWRGALDRQLRPCAARMFELERSTKGA
jgi:hypothetical protein